MTTSTSTCTDYTEQGVHFYPAPAATDTVNEA